MRKALLVVLLIFLSAKSFSQGFNHTWLLGYTFGTSPKARINFTLNSDTIITEPRIMSFHETQGNISDAYGNFLMSSNGIFIANANNNMMMNGDSLNPSPFTSAWSDGLPQENANVFLPYPEDSAKYILFHETGTFNGAWYPVRELLYSVIDMSLDGGLGGVILKNDTIIQDTFGWGYAACKHGNGRDWWITALKDSSDLVFKILLTPNGITSISSEHLNVLPYAWGNVTQTIFSPEGTKFAYSYTYFENGVYRHDVRLFNFDRCAGTFSNPLVIDLTDSIPGFGVAFSSDSKYLYSCSFEKIYQLNTDTSDIPASLTIVGINDTFYSPFPPLFTNFLDMYLAANGKIYITSGNGVVDLHYINYPDSAGIACDVHLHDLHLPCFHKRSVPNHPNYYLGCDTTGSCPCLTVMDNLTQQDFRFRIYPNPVLSASGGLNIGYLLPQNKSGLFQIYDITGKIVFKYTLPPWSNEQSFKLPMLNDGIYNSVITSGNNRVSKKMAVINE